MRHRSTVALLSTTATLALATVLGGATPALAAVPPTNDLKAGAIAVTTLPFSQSVDTSAATTDADDSALNANCGAPVTNGSVWYTYHAAAGVSAITVDISASSFSAGAIIAESDGVGGYHVVACGPGTTGTTVTPGLDYQVLAFSDTPGVTGGTLRLTIDQAVIPTVSVTVNPRGKVDRSGNALISGTYTCTGADFFSLFTSVKQAVGRFAILGDGFFDSSCDGRTLPWTAVVVPYNGKFAGGKAATFTFSFACGALYCADSYTEQAIRLSR